jgi:S-adenosylmethionine:tRNA-ribosyltransferase-isomerase (queuine synthetase)
MRLVPPIRPPAGVHASCAGGLVGHRRILNAYEEAIRSGYRFSSYGDASFLEW